MYLTFSCISTEWVLGWLVLIVRTWSNICWSDVSCYVFISRLCSLGIAGGIMLHVKQANMYSLCSLLLDVKVWINIKKLALKLEHFDLFFFFLFSPQKKLFSFLELMEIASLPGTQQKSVERLNWFQLTHCEGSTITTVQKTILTRFIHKNHNCLEFVHPYYSGWVCLHTHIFTEYKVHMHIYKYLYTPMHIICLRELEITVTTVWSICLL